jgi:hypothetical protein
MVSPMIQTSEFSDTLVKKTSSVMERHAQFQALLNPQLFGGTSTHLLQLYGNTALWSRGQTGRTLADCPPPQPSHSGWAIAEVAAGFVRQR